MKVVFLDRDGVINKFPGNGKYVTKLKDFHFLPGALEGIRLLTENGFNLFVVSNQAGVGKGVYSKTKLISITRHMLETVKKSGGRIRKVFYCVHRSDMGCTCRKPEIGSIRAAMKILNTSIRSAKKAFFIGDTVVDIMAGKNAGCRTVFLLSGRENHRHLRKKNVKPNYIVKDLLEASTLITRLSKI